MTVPEFITAQNTLCSMSKTAAVELVTSITGQAVRTVWLQAAGKVKTPPPVERLLDIYMSPALPAEAKEALFFTR